MRVNDTLSAAAAAVARCLCWRLKVEAMPVSIMPLTIRVTVRHVSGRWQHVRLRMRGEMLANLHDHIIMYMYT